MRTLACLVVLGLMIAPRASHAQNAIAKGAIEVEGAVLYSHVSYGAPDAFNINTDLTERSLSVEPSIGYFLTDRVELTFQPAFSLRSANVSIHYEYPGVIVEDYRTTSTQYDASFLGGIVYHVPISGDRFVGFLGTSAGIEWFKYSTTYEGVLGAPEFEGDWSRPIFTYLNFSSGLKIFFLPDWALIPRVGVRYMGTPDRYLLGGFDHTWEFSFGAGISVFFKGTGAEQ